MRKKGYKQTEEHKKKIGLTNSAILKGRALSESHRHKIIESNKSEKRREILRSVNTGRKLSDDTKKKMSLARKTKGLGIGNNYSELAYERILSEIPELEKQGFKCIPIGKVVPDIIAIKDGKVYAIEVERGKPNYSKYDKDNYKKMFEDIIWILR